MTQLYSDPSAVPSKVATLVRLQPNLKFSVRNVCIATAFAFGASTSAPSVAAVHASQIDASSSGVQVLARDEELKPKASDFLQEIREKTGLTWDQLAKIIGVTRRTLHACLAGTSQLRAKSVAKIEEVLETVRASRGEPAFRIRNTLLANASIDPVSDVSTTLEAPLLASDNQPLKHPVRKKRESSMRIKRG